MKNLIGFAPVVVSVLATAGRPAAAAAALQPPAATAQTAPKLGTVTGTLILDGKPIALHSAVAVTSLNPIMGMNMLKVALTPEQIPIDPRPADTLADRLDQTFKTGLSLDMDDAARCLVLMIRDPSLGDRRLVKTGFAVCGADAVRVVGSERVEGTVMSSPDGKEEIVSGHKVSFTLHFNAPVAKQSQAVK